MPKSTPIYPLFSKLNQVNEMGKVIIEIQGILIINK